MVSVLIPTSVPYSPACFFVCRIRVGCIWGQWDHKSIMICLSRIYTFRNEWCMSVSSIRLCVSHACTCPEGPTLDPLKLKSRLVSKQPDPGSEHWTWIVYKSTAHLTTELFLSSPLYLGFLIASTFLFYLFPSAKKYIKIWQNFHADQKNYFFFGLFQ